MMRVVLIISEFLEGKTERNLWPLATTLLLFLTVTVPTLIWTPLPQNQLRVIVTLFSAALIYVGGFYKVRAIFWRLFENCR